MLENSYFEDWDANIISLDIISIAVIGWLQAKKKKTNPILTLHKIHVFRLIWQWQRKRKEKKHNLRCCSQQKPHYPKYIYVFVSQKVGNKWSSGVEGGSKISCEITNKRKCKHYSCWTHAYAKHFPWLAHSSGNCLFHCLLVIHPVDSLPNVYQNNFKLAIATAVVRSLDALIMAMDVTVILGFKLLI